MVVLDKFNSTQFASLQTIQGRILYDTTLNALRYNDSTGYNNIIVEKNTSNDVTGINDITVSNNFNITNHNGTSTGLQLADVLVTSSAIQLNKNIVTPGSGTAGLTLVLDSSRNINNINTLSATTINLTQLNLLNMNTTGNVGINTSSLTYGLEVNEANGQCLRLSYNNAVGSATNYANLTVASDGTLSIEAVGTTASVNIANHNGTTLGLQLANTLVTSSAVQLNYLNSVPGTAAPSLALVLDSSSDITNINNITSTGTLIPNVLSTATTGTVTSNMITAYQSSLTAGNKSSVVLGQSSTNYNSGQVNFNYTSTGSTSNSVSMSLYGQSNAFTVIGAGNININNHNGTVGLQLAGTTVTSSAVQLNYSKVTPGTGTASLAVVLDASRNITNMNNISSTGAISINNAASTATYMIGAYQSGLTTTNSNYLTFGQAASSYNAINLGFTYSSSGSTSNLFGIALFGQSNKFTVSGLGNVNITGHNGTVGLNLGESLVTSSAVQLNYLTVTAGTAAATKAVVINASSNITNMNNITAAGATITSNLLNVTNTTSTTANLITAYQSALTTTNSNSVLFGQSATNNNSVQLTFNYNTASSTSNTIGISLYGQAAPLTISGLGTVNIVNHNGSTDGLFLGGNVVPVTAAQLNYNTVTAGTATANKTLVLNSSGSVTTVVNLGVNTITATTLNLSSVSFGTTYNNQILALYNGGSSFYGFGCSATELMYQSYTAHTWYTGTSNKATLPRSDSAGTQRMTLTTAGALGLGTSVPTSQMEINSTTGSCLKLTYNNSTGNGANNAILSVTSTGTLNITASGTAASVNIPNCDNSTYGLQLAGSLVTATATQLNYTMSTPGTSIASKALVTDSTNSLTSLNYLDAASALFLTQNTENNTVAYPVNLLVYPGTDAGVGLGTGMQYSSVNDTNQIFNAGYINYVSTSITTNSESGYFDIRVINAGTVVSAVTIANTGVLSCTSLVETSDIREKENIQDLDMNESLDKILKINVKTYNYIKDENKVNHTGVIAQELKEILPSAVVIRANEDYEDFHQVHYTEMIPHLINCVKELNLEFMELENELTILKN